MIHSILFSFRTLSKAYVEFRSNVITSSAVRKIKDSLNSSGYLKNSVMLIKLVMYVEKFHSLMIGHHCMW
jgi:hypothetical protein